ncbi:MAG TPA: LamG domain-containing protein, partial [Segetibacter sp.]|nr:LamG domain-containing protein [Segetibacter sp.]
MIPTSTNHYRPFSTEKGYHKFLLKVPILLILLFSATAAKADWWTEVHHASTSAGSHFNASFNPATGNIHVETYAWNGEYLNLACCIFYSMWVESATMSYSVDGTNYIDFYKFGFDHGDRTVSTQISPYTTTSYTSSSTTGDRLLNMDLQLINSIKNIKNIRIRAHLVGDGPAGVGGSQDIEDTKTVTVTQMSSISTPTYEFLPVSTNGVFNAKARVSYTKFNLNEVDNNSSMVLYDASTNPDTRLSGNLPIATSGSFDVAISNAAKDYYYQQVAYNERLSINSSNVTVPAFTFPKTATATYDPIVQQVNFSWTMDPVTSSNVVTDKFKIQVADNANFTDAREVSVDYDPTQSSVSYPVTANFSPHMYFRVSRQRVGFNWEIAAKADVTVSFSSIPATATAVLVNKMAVLTWNPLASAWLPGSTFIITRLNNTTYTQNEIRLNKQDFDKGTYNDAQIAVCNSYSYSLQVVPPASSSFTAFAPVQVAGQILPTEIGSLVTLEVSKGYFPDRTELRWSTSGAFDNFIVKRAVYGTTNFVQVATVPGAGTSEYQTDDGKGTPGVYYTYQVIGVVKCNNTNVFSKETLTGIGFRTPTGNIYGRITYDNGQAVEDVAVRLQSSDQVQLGKSIYLNGTTDSYLKLDSTTAPFSDSAFTIEAWIKPDATSPVNQLVFQRNNQYSLGFDAAGKLFFSYKGAIVTGTYSNSTNVFVHVTGIHTKDSLFIMLNNDVIGKAAVAYSASNPDRAVYIGRGQTGQLFKGFIDEMRVYNIAISQAQVVKNQTRLFTGDEAGLIGYWRFDETINNEFYDLSFHGENFNRNDGTMSSTAVSRSTTIPTADQLSLKSFTDLSGNYFIAGIPYVGNGTTYTVVPL